MKGLSLQVLMAVFTVLKSFFGSSLFTYTAAIAAVSGITWFGYLSIEELRGAVSIILDTFLI